MEQAAVSPGEEGATDSGDPDPDGASECPPEADCGPVVECVASESTVELDHALADGRTVGAVLESTLGTHAISVGWTEGAPSLGTLGLVWDESALTLRTYEAFGGEITECDRPSITVGLTASLQTDDGALDEIWTTQASLNDEGELDVVGRFSLDALGGSYQNDEIAELGLRVELDGAVSPASIYGSIDGYGASTPPSDGAPGTAGGIDWIATIERPET